MRKKDLIKKIGVMKTRDAYLMVQIERLEWEVKQAEMERLRAVEALEEKQDVLETAFQQNDSFLKEIVDLKDELNAVRKRNQMLQNNAIENQNVIKSLRKHGIEHLKSPNF